ncbi:MAG TPA: methyltransferase domain-containing protein [Leifsonia sp.]|nr:methyltransferase domain-containing protein [Leifsonia sp.]
MTLDSLAEWLRCPVCTEPLSPVERLTLGCASGHRFDVNRRGYVTLVAGNSRLSGDSAEMLASRDRVLESGLYSPVAVALAEMAVGRAVLDAGVGTGYYLRAVLAANPGAHGLAMDLSPAAVARAVRPEPGTPGPVIDGLVTDTWRPLPVRDGVCDVVLNVFAPRNLPEFHRVLRLGGNLLVVVPRTEHLAELRAAGRMLDVPPDKASAVIDAAARLFTLREQRAVRETIPLTPEVADALVGMGPSAHHRRSDVGALPRTATLAVDLLWFVSR